MQRQEVITEHGAGTGSACGSARKVVRLEEARWKTGLRRKVRECGLCPEVKREVSDYTPEKVIVTFTLLTIRIWDI